MRRVERVLIVASAFRPTRLRVVATMFCLLALTAHTTAHEIGTTQVVATFSAAGDYQIDVSVDPDALLTRLQILETGDVQAPAGREDRDRRLSALMPAFARALRLRFDGADARFAIAYLPASAIGDLAQAPSTIRVTGHVPDGARALTLSYALATGTFALVAHVRDSAAQTFWIEGNKESGSIALAAPPPPPTGRQVAARYFSLGFTHILPKGLDHILFVVGLFLLGTRWKPVLFQISAFTLAHSITLGLTIYGVVSLPARVVEPMIALSIAYVALENVVTSELKSWRVALVFAFGLLHGMGFAGVLRDLGLPRADFLTALVTFNLGVEAGQLAVVGAAFAAVAYWRRNASTYRRAIVQPASIAIAATGLYWTVQRLF